MLGREQLSMQRGNARCASATGQAEESHPDTGAGRPRRWFTVDQLTLIWNAGSEAVAHPSVTVITIPLYVPFTA
jgi:hypothetical protein